MGKYSLKEFFVNESETDANDEAMYDPIHEDLEYNAKLGDQQFKVTFDVNKNETKKGIKIKFFPLENGQPREFISPEELDKISNDLAVKLTPKFVKYKLELDRDEDAPEKNAAAFMIPLDSFVAFLQEFVLKA
jgi:hypothetical protein